VTWGLGGELQKRPMSVCNVPGMSSSKQNQESSAILMVANSFQQGGTRQTLYVCVSLGDKRGTKVGVEKNGRSKSRQLKHEDR